MKIEDAKTHELAVCQAVGEANKAIMEAICAGCVVELDVINVSDFNLGYKKLISAVVKVHPGDIET